MEFTSLISARRSVRSFLAKEVEPAKVQRVISAAMMAPSAGNLQSYKVYLVRSDDARHSLMMACEGASFVSEAPVSLVFCADITRSGARYEERGEELYSYQDATIACAYAQLAAADLGLGSCWVGAFEPLEVARIVGADAYEVPVAVLPLGYASEEPEPSGRRPPSEILKEV